MPQSDGSYSVIPGSSGGFVARLRAFTARMFATAASAPAAAPPAPAPSSQDESPTMTTPLLPRQK